MSRTWRTWLGLAVAGVFGLRNRPAPTMTVNVCGRAQSAQGDELVAVIEACTRITVQRTRMTRSGSIALSGSGPAAEP